MFKPFQSERVRIFLALGAYLFVCLLSGYWLYPAIITLFIYILILFSESYRTVRWLEKGASTSHYPNVGGVSEAIVSSIYQLRKRGKFRNKRLKAILDRFYSMAVGLPDGVIVLTADSEIEWSNERAVELLGIDHERDNGQRIDNLIREPSFHDYLERGDFEEPIRIMAPVGLNITLNIRMVKFKDGAQLLLARDLSNIVQAEAVRKGFVSNVSHEMRTPLTVINGYTEMLLGDTQLNDEFKKPLEAIHNQSLRLQNIIDGLLDLSRLQDRPNQEFDEQVPVASLVREIVSEALSLKKIQTHTIDVDIDDDLLLDGSVVLFQSVVSNLIYNAIHHTQTGTHIDVYWGEVGDGTREFVVTDNGQGIEAEHLTRITERFYRVDSSRVRQTGDEFGAGLGLSIVKHIVEVHKGELKVSSRLDYGTTFRCVFADS